jgi:hypothetical protein
MSTLQSAFQASYQGTLKGESITVRLTSCLTCLDYSVLQIKMNTVSCHTVDSKPVKQEVNNTVILPPLVFPGRTIVLRVAVLHFKYPPPHSGNLKVKVKKYKF